MPFTICTIGCGGMATAAHGYAYAKYVAEHPNTLLAACCDIDTERAESFRARFGFARFYTDLLTMLERERPDAVCLVAPVELTCELSCRVLEQGFPLLLEKPPGQTVDELDRILAVAQAKGVAAQVAFNRRYAPLLLRLHSLLEEQVEAGSLQHLQVEFTRTGRTDPDFSTTAIHGIDTARFLVGSDYQEILFHYHPLPHLGNGVANLFLSAVFENGVTARLNFCPTAGEIVERYTLHAEGQTFRAHIPCWNTHDAQGLLQHFRAGKCLLDTTCEVATHGEMFEANGFYGENAAFFNAIRAGKPVHPDLSQSRQSVEVMEHLRNRSTHYVRATS